MFETKLGYKIVERYEDGIRTLFHGNYGTRRIEQGRWVRAEVRPRAKDGTSKTTYQSGFHLLPTFEDAVQYMSRFKNRLDKLVIVPVWYDVNTSWRKTHSRAPVILASHVNFPVDIVM
jgi:hypothetical protein